MIADYRSYRRAGHLRYALLPGGDAGVRNPCRMALSHLSAAGLGWDSRLPSVAACTDLERSVLARQLETGLNSLPTSSMGRLFDAMSSLDRHLPPDRVRGRGRHALRRTGPAGDRGLRARRTASPSTRPVRRSSPIRCRCSAPPRTTCSAAPRRRSSPRVSITPWPTWWPTWRSRLRDQTMINTVALSGGVFLNVLLTRLCVDRLLDRDFRVLRHSEVPPSDAGIALGQLVIGAQISGGRSSRCA